MAEVLYTNDPTVADLVVFNFTTTNTAGDPVNPYKVNKVTIYFIDKGYATENTYSYDVEIAGNTYTEYFKEAIPIEVFGDDTTAVWFDTNSDFATKTDTGEFELKWQPSLAKEGNYIFCYQWQNIISGDVYSASLNFYLYADTTQNPVIPTHRTVPEKYEVLLDRYLPEVFKSECYKGDISPDILERTNQAIAKGFTGLEDLANRMLDILDANSTPSIYLPYLAKLFDLDLYSTDTTLWRKQIKRAIPLYKKKGSIDGLKEALLNADITFVKLTKYWQVVSKSTWQEEFKGTASEWELEKVALSLDGLNFELYLNDVSVSITNVSFTTLNGVTTMTWIGDELADDDLIRIIYLFSTPTDQITEDYIRTLPLMDQRSETTYPKKNWNVRLIAEDDVMFDVIIPTRHPYTDFVAYGNVRTEFPYSENIFNMDEWNGSTKLSTDPCDLDKDFLDSCSACQSSCISVDLKIEELSSERLEEAERIIKNFIPFHTILYSINYTGVISEFFPCPQESLTILGRYSIQDNVMNAQYHFNRLIEDGNDYLLELKRNMLADTVVTDESGNIKNIAVTLFSPGVNFSSIGIGDNNRLEILSGLNTGNYTLENPQKTIVDIVESLVSVNSNPFPFRISNELYSDVVSIYRIDDSRFYDIDWVTYGTIAGWKIIIVTGIYAGTYIISAVNPDNSVSLPGLTVSLSNVSYELRTDANALRHTGLGTLVTTQIGRVECDLEITQALGISPGDYVEYSGSQYKILSVENNIDAKFYIEGYSGSDVVGVASVIVHRRIAEGTGYLNYRGLVLTGTTPTINNTLEVNQFKENYMILIGSNYYQIDNISGSDMTLTGKIIDYGLVDVPISYSIVQFVKTSPITTQDGHEFVILDRRGDDTITITSESVTPMAMAFASMSDDSILDLIPQKENIRIRTEYR